MKAIKRIVVTFTDGTSLTQSFDPDNHARLKQFTNWRWMREGLAKWMGGEYSETWITWVEPVNSKPAKETTEDEQPRDYEPVVDAGRDTRT
jgi:hypothetical protein